MVAARAVQGANGRWLATPSRVAGLGRRNARLMLAGWLVMLIVAALMVPSAPTMPEFLHDAIVATIRHGGDFYDSARDLLRTEPDAHAAMALPSALAVVEAALPRWAMTALVAAALTILLWVGGLRLGALLARTAGAAMIVGLLAGGGIAVAALWLAAPHAGAAAILSATAIVARQRDRHVAAVATACAAALIDPAALVTIAAMGMLAFLDGSRREIAAWTFAFALVAAVFALHLHTLAGVALPRHHLDTIGDPLARLVGAAFPEVPGGLAAALLALSVIGWATVGDMIGLRVLAVMIAGVALDGVMGVRSATLIAALVAPGLALAPGGIGDAARIALDRRRITVTRVVR
jgi:hypothetical protein